MPLTSIVILTKNGERTIGECLNSLFTQNFTDFETIIVDSGSTDKTIQIASTYPVRIIKIRPEKFHHAKTRNYAASLCNGEFIVFLTQDAYAKNSTWLQKLLQPFNNKHVAATYSRQIPRQDTNPVERAFLHQTYPQIKRKEQQLFSEQENPDNFVVLSDVSSAYRKTLVKFNPELEWCEDQEMGLRLNQAGYQIQYVPESLVCHSHNCTFIELIHRYRSVGKAASKFSKKGYSSNKSLKYITKLFASTLSYIAKDKCTKLKPFWLPYSIVYNSIRISGFILGYLPNRRQTLTIDTE